MAEKGLAAFIVDYIAGRRQVKLDEHDKKAAKNLLAVTDNERNAQHADLLLLRQELLQQYEPRTWLTSAAQRAGQINLVTHAAKYTHGYTKSSSFYSVMPDSEGYLTTATLDNAAVDAVGNAAALDVARLLQTEVEGDSLLACLQRGDTTALAELAEDESQLAAWVEGFSQALTIREPASHKLAKQIYFPVGEGYHLLNPLFSSSLAQALHQRMIALRFSEESKAIRKARRENRWHAKPLVWFPHSAVMKFGGTKPQNISALNSSRGGRAWLLSCASPQWERQHKPPLGSKSLFSTSIFDRNTRATRMRLIDLLNNASNDNNHRIRKARDRYIDEIIDILFSLAAEIQQTWQGWTRHEECQMKCHQQLWLDPFRAYDDDAFRQERENSAWQEAVAEDFALWLNSHLRRAGLSVGKTEKGEWQSRPLFRRRLHDMEQALRSDCHA